MGKKKGFIIVYVALLVFITSFSFAENLFDSTTIRGFGTIGGSYNDNKNIEYKDTLLATKNSNKNFSFATDTKFGLQADTRLSDRLSLTLQGLVRQLDETGIDGSLEWANLKYSFDETSYIRIGRMRTPAFMYSDIINVSYAYPWASLPNEVYASIPTTSFNGVELSKSFMLSDLILNTKFIYGSETNKIYMDKTNTAEFELKKGFGAVISSSFGNLSTRASFLQSNLTIKSPLMDSLVTGLRTFGLNSIADDYELKDEKTRFYGFGFAYDMEKLFFIGEYTLIESAPLIKELRGYYLSGGYRLGKFTPYVVAARSDYKGLYPETRVVGPLLSAANKIAQSASTAQKSYSLGLKYDFTENANLNIQYQKIDVDDDHLTIFNRIGDNRDDLDVFTITVNYVF